MENAYISARDPAVLMYIDTHCHLRDEDLSYKETISHGLSVADRAGFTLVMDIANHPRPRSTRDDALRRFELAENAKSEVIYGLYLILTKDPAQIKQAVKAYDELKYRPGCKTFISGLKMFAGQSTGNAGIVEPAEQLMVYERLAGEGFDGVMLVHCEMESDFPVGVWDPSAPVTHAYSRPWRSEVSSVDAQICHMSESGFQGRLHIAHASVPQSLELVRTAHDLGARIAAEVTPHHRLLDMSMMSDPDGILLKMLPPLRSREMADGLHPFLADERMDYVWIASDHAPHTLDEKINPARPKPYAAGIPGLYFIPRFAQILRSMGVSQKRVEDLTFNNAARAFGLTDLKPRKVDAPQGTLNGLASEYSFDPYKAFW